MKLLYSESVFIQIPTFLKTDHIEKEFRIDIFDRLIKSIYMDAKLDLSINYNEGTLEFFEPTNNELIKIQYTDKLGRLCHRILKNCVVRENTTLDSPARVFSSNKNMFIEINTNDAFFKNEKHVMFALMHEALHIAFGHMFLDTSIYDMEKLNISFDASINPYILSFIDNNNENKKNKRCIKKRKH